MFVSIDYFSSCNLTFISSLLYLFSFNDLFYEWIDGILCKVIMYAHLYFSYLEYTYSIFLCWHHVSLPPPIGIFHIDIYPKLELWPVRLNTLISPTLIYVERIHFVLCLDSVLYNNNCRSLYPFGLVELISVVS